MMYVNARKTGGWSQGEGMMLKECKTMLGNQVRSFKEKRKTAWFTLIHYAEVADSFRNYGRVTSGFAR